MDELNQIQNPNVPPILQSQPMQSSPTPPMSPMPSKKKSSLFLIVIIVLVAVGAFAWWYIGQMSEEPLAVEEPKVNQEAREDIQINKDLGEVDMGNLDAEFLPVDNDINSL